MRYEIPEEPKVDRVWTRTPSGGWLTWERAPGDRWWQGMGCALYRWEELLRRHGPVDDVHPALQALPPLPWRYTPVDGIVDADGSHVDPRTMAGDVLVRIVTEWAATLTSEWS